MCVLPKGGILPGHEALWEGAFVTQALTVLESADAKDHEIFAVKHDPNVARGREISLSAISGDFSVGVARSYTPHFFLDITFY